MLPILLSAIPSLISVAEKIIPKSEGSGSRKKQLVMSALELVYDKGVDKLLPDFPNVDEKKLFLRTCEVWIEELVPQLTR